MWSCELFEENLENKSYMELADWLTSCRQVVLRENYDTHEQYIKNTGDGDVCQCSTHNSVPCVIYNHDD